MQNIRKLGTEKGEKTQMQSFGNSDNVTMPKLPITNIFHSVLTSTSDGSEEMEGFIDNLLKRLLDEDLLGTLMLCTYGSDQIWMEDEFWQGIRCEETTQFWGERIIALARQSSGEQAAFGNRHDATVVDQIQRFCLAPNKFPDEGNDSNECGEGNDMGIICLHERIKRQAIESRRRHVVELKRTLLREICGTPAQLFSMQGTQQQPAQNIRANIQSEDD
ncbi:hypothetical protein BDV93DRAFT_515198 [Ceratobasidium sp. AG-I]|nr:hypothetical protein BDV93DRAFT_515198 [Ceratobasidium sp. AG-I]